MPIIGLSYDNVSPNPLILSSTSFMKPSVWEAKRKKKGKRAYVFLLYLYNRFFLSLLISIKNNTGLGVAVGIKIYLTQFQ